MAKKVILGTDIARDAFKTKVNENFTELYDKDASLEEQINSLTSELDLSSNLLNGWEIYNISYPFLLVKTGRNVTLHTLIKGGTLTLGTTIAVINDIKFRPRNNLQFGVFGNDGTVNIGLITSGGEIRIQNHAWVSSSEYTICISYASAS